MKTIEIGYYRRNGVELIMGVYDGKLCLLDYLHRAKRSTIDNRLQKGLSAKYKECENALHKEVAKELDEYFKGQRQSFTTPLLLIGSEFQKSVWQTLLTIPYGTTKSYKAQAQILGDSKKVRAVANANGANAIAIIVPCHRVVASDGSLGGYAGGIETKVKLLDIEQNHVRG